MRKLLCAIIVICLFILPASAEETKLQVERQVYAYLTEEMGLPGASACGILANIEQESNFNPHALGDNGTSYGLCQWHDGRYSSLIAFCRRNDLDHKTTEGQLEYLRHELEGTYAELLGKLRVQEDSPSGAYRAAYLWCVEFERPSNMEKKGILRGNLARGKYWSRYDGSFVLAEPEEEETYAPEEVLRIVIEHDVTIPEAPETEPVVTEEGETAPEPTLVEPFEIHRLPPAETEEPAAPKSDRLPLAVGAAVTGFTGVGLLLRGRGRKEEPENVEEGAI